MNEELMIAMGFRREVANFRAGNCATCGKKIRMGEFVDLLSIREYGISGMCQTCQDSVFEREDDDDLLL